MKALVFVLLLIGAFAVPCTGTPTPVGCKDCDGTTTTKCIECTDPDEFLDETDNKCVATCPDGTFGADAVGTPAVKKCTACKLNANCKTCTDATSGCVTCDTTGTYKYLQDDKTCVSSCGDGKFANAENKCTPCKQNANCKTCTSATSACVTCPADENKYLALDGTCATECTGTYFDSANKCVACTASLNCKTCPSATACTTCDKTSDYKFLKTNGGCYKSGECPDNAGSLTTGTDNNAVYTCADCESTGCGVCTSNGSTKTCTACFAKGYYQKTDKPITCEVCKSGSNCETCTNGDSCATCDQGGNNKYLALDGACGTGCTGTYADSSNKCVACTASLNCETCTSATACATCADKSYFKDSACVTDCGDGYNKNEETQTCDAVSFGSYLFSGLAILLAILTFI